MARPVLPLACVAAVLAAAGVAPSSPGAACQVSGGTPKQRALACRIAGRLGAGAVLRISIDTTPAHVDPATQKRRPAVAQLHLAYETDGQEPASSKTKWEAWLVAGAFRDLSAARRLPRVTSAEVNGEGEVIYCPPSRCRLGRDASAGRLRRAARRGSGAARVQLEEVRLLHPLRFAPLIVVRTSDPAGFRGDDEARARIAKLVRQLRGALKHGQRLDGFYVEVRDQQERMIALCTTSARVGMGNLITRTPQGRGLKSLGC